MAPFLVLNKFVIASLLTIARLLSPAIPTTKQQVAMCALAMGCMCALAMGCMCALAMGCMCALAMGCIIGWVLLKAA